jgi:predicted regulator of Ras-like GTPase activity (Roadblock/LC7/MglB family)
MPTIANASGGQIQALKRKRRLFLGAIAVPAANKTLFGCIMDRMRQTSPTAGHYFSPGGQKLKFFALILQKPAMAHFLLKSVRCAVDHKIDHINITMSNFAKNKFTGLLRGLLHRLDSSKGNGVETPRPDNSTMPSATTSAADAQTESSPSQPISTPAPARVANPNELELPLQPILASLPMDLRAKVVQAPLAGAVVAISVEKVLSQLANGAVKITFGELRTAVPNFFVNSGGQFDARPVTLPLNEILTRLNPSLLSRRAAQKQVEVADDIAGPFAGRGQGITFTATPLKDNAPASPAPPAPSQPAPSSSTSFTPRWTSPAAKNTTPPSGNGNGNGNGKNGNSAHTNGGHAPSEPILPSAARPFFSAASLHPNAPPATPPTAAVPEELQLTLSAPIAALSENWPDAVKLEIVRSDLSRSQIEVPLNLLEPGLKRGRITFTWKNLRAFIRPAAPALPANENLEVELPLKVITPLFFARQKTTAKPQPKLSVSREIPDLFFGFPQPQAPSPTSPPKASSETQFRMQSQPETAVPEVNRMMLSLMPKPVDTNFYSAANVAETAKSDGIEHKKPQSAGTDFTSRQMTPKDVVTSAMALPSVAGVVIALPDGLRVANAVPADLNADTLAAFLPQIFERVSQSTKELRMGALNNVSFTVGNIPWKIFRVNAVYFAAFGREGESLPTAQLAQLATQLDRKKSQ